jgi:ankyrin repeat protein
MAPIHDACTYKAGDVEAVRRELAAGVSPDLRGNQWGHDDVTPLLIAANHEHMEIVLLLLDAGADVHLVGSGGFTALKIACLNSNKSIIAVLIAAGPSLHVESSRNQKLPIEMHGFQPKRIVPMLLRAGSPLPHPERTAWMLTRHSIFNAAATNYVNAVAAAGGFVPYERAHTKRLAAIFVPKFTWLPAEVIPTIVGFWAHTGCY